MEDEDACHAGSSRVRRGFGGREEISQHTIGKKKRKDLLNKAHSAIILCLGHRVLREVSKEKSVAALWLKLENLYMTKSLAYRLYLKQKLYTPLLKFIWMSLIGLSLTWRTLKSRLMMKIKPSFLFNHCLAHMRILIADTLAYGKESLTLEEVQAALNSKEMGRKLEDKEVGTKESLTTRGRSDKRNNKGKNRSRSKPKGKLKCFLCHKEGHFKRNCPEQKKKKKLNHEDKGDASIASDGYESADVLVAANCQTEAEWIMDFGCSFHMGVF